MNVIKGKHTHAYKHSLNNLAVAILKTKNKNIDKITILNKKRKKKSEEDLTLRLITHGHDLIYFIFGCSILFLSMHW